MAVPLRRAPPTTPRVHALPFVGDDAKLVEGLRARNPQALAALCDRYADHALRVLARILGDDPDLLDLRQDVLLRVVRSARGITDASSLQGWVTIIAVNVARSTLRRRKLQRWLSFLPWNEVPDVEARSSSDDDSASLERLYAILGKLPAEERIVFTLRFVDEMPLQEIATACGVSLATTKRRISAAEGRFTAFARKDPLLRNWLQGGTRWSSR